ncbi:MAG: hypothetical protein H7249_16065 [Chitinophagaceae bacterium]|nr:hypothetical protein [Oligoflexus sp.]
MLQRLTLTFMFMFSIASTAFAGIIGVGGSTTVADKVKDAEVVSVQAQAYRRLNTRLSGQNTVNAEVINNRNEKEQADFMKVKVDGQSCIVEKNYRMKLKPIAE